MVTMEMIPEKMNMCQQGTSTMLSTDDVSFAAGTKTTGDYYNTLAEEGLTHHGSSWLAHCCNIDLVNWRKGRPYRWPAWWENGNLRGLGFSDWDWCKQECLPAQAAAALQEANGGYVWCKRGWGANGERLGLGVP